MGAIPQPIYERIKEILSRKEPVAIVLLSHGAGEITEAIDLRVNVTPAKS